MDVRLVEERPHPLVLARYGGDVTVRKWLGKKAEEKPLTGHHIGVYGQVLTYDFETGGRGYMGGEPGGSLFDRANFVGGIEYGYALPVARRLNLDFSIGIGYMGGNIMNMYRWTIVTYGRPPSNATISAPPGWKSRWYGCSDKATSTR